MRAVGVGGTVVPPGGQGCYRGSGREWVGVGGFEGGYINGWRLCGDQLSS